MWLFRRPKQSRKRARLGRIANPSCRKCSFVPRLELLEDPFPRHGVPMGEVTRILFESHRLGRTAVLVVRRRLLKNLRKPRSRQVGLSSAVQAQERQA